MSLQKKYLKTRPMSKVTFRLPAADVAQGASVNLVGEFNGWDPTATPMNRLKSGDYKVTVDLQVGQEYQFRYLIDGHLWVNETEADKHLPTGLGTEENSVVVV